MDQVKIGNFIKECRKAKKLTQIQLAIKIGVSEKTISKWECGNGFPDAPLMQPLCKALGITANELLSGKYLNNDNDYQKLAENNLINLKQLHEKTIKFLLTLEIVIGILSVILMIVIVSRTREIDHLDKLKASLLSLELSKPVGGIVVNINSQRTNTILGKHDYLLYGERFIYAKIDDISYKVNYKSFFQVNPFTTDLLYKKALELCALTGNETVFDLYCGIGTISLFLAKCAKKVIGVEIVPEAILDARENAKLNNITNAEFYTGAAEDICPSLIQSGEKAHVVVVDPPRKGCDEKLLDAIGKMKPEKIVYVSCNVSTLARDAKYLCEKYGYKMKEAFPFDQFPHSMHVEAVAAFI